MFDVLEARFSAAVAAEEDRAAEDLAFSLRQGRPLREALGRGSWTVALPSHGSTAVGLVATDYVAALDGRLLVPLVAGVFRAAPGSPPRLVDGHLRTCLSRAARLGSAIEVALPGGGRRGRLSRVGADYLEILGTQGTTLVPLATVLWIRLSREGSVDAP